MAAMTPSPDAPFAACHSAGEAFEQVNQETTGRGGLKPQVIVAISVGLITIFGAAFSVSRSFVTKEEADRSYQSKAVYETDRENTKQLLERIERGQDRLEIKLDRFVEKAGPR